LAYHSKHRKHQKKKSQRTPGKNSESGKPENPKTGKRGGSRVTWGAFKGKKELGRHAKGHIKNGIKKRQFVKLYPDCSGTCGEEGSNIL